MNCKSEIKSVDIEQCYETWTTDDLKLSVNKPVDFTGLSVYGWVIDDCNNAYKDNVFIRNNGVLELPYYLPMDYDEWLDSPDVMNDYDQIYSELINVLER